ncbi:hypothetical protein [Litchfieldella rifensis]|uniref:Uncharacterized protein n=1 Tax=Litchfieldella rifensis TaxID=762643 RepID=A0ABV7LL37_9GAMM
MRFLFLSLLFFLPSVSYASWQTSTFTQSSCTTGGSPEEAESKAWASYADTAAQVPGRTYVFISDSATTTTGWFGCPSAYRHSLRFVFSDTDPVDHYLADGKVAYNRVYSDAECELAYGEGSTSTGQMNSTETGEGACNYVTPLTPDEECQALTSGGSNFVSLPFHPDPSQPSYSFEWDHGGCEFKTHGVWLETPSGDWSAQYTSTGAVPGATEVEAEAPVVPDEADEVSSNYTPTDNPSNDCPYSNVSFGGSSYCYSGSDAPQGDSYGDGSSRVNHWDGSFTITDPDGTSTTYNPDGSVKDSGTAPTDPGQGAGYVSNGCPPWAPAWLCSGKTSTTDGIIGPFTEGLPDADGLIGDSNIDESLQSMDGDGEGYTAGLDSQFDELEKGIPDEVTAFMPQTGGGGCSPLSFGNGAYSFEISCEAFNKISVWLGWIVYFWTAVSIIDTFFSPVIRSK